MDTKTKQLLALCTTVVDAVRAGGDQGVPGGTLYAALMTVGCSLDQFEGLMRALVETRQVTRRGDLYFAAGLRVPT